MFIYNSTRNILKGSRRLLCPSTFNSVNLKYERLLHTTKTLWANVSFNLTDIGEGIREVAVKEWFVKEGDRVAQFDNICEVQSDKASVTITSRYDGVITKLHYKIDDTALVGKPLVDIETENDVKGTKKSEETENVDTTATTSNINTTSSSSSSSDSSTDVEKIICIPSVRRIAKENNIDLTQIKGTGKQGRILKEDLLRFLQSPPPQPPKTEQIVADKVVPVKGFTKAMIKSMTEALKVPHFGFADEIILTQLTKVKNSLKEDAQKAGVKLTIMPFIIKAASNCLHEYPILNSSLDSKCENITYKSCHNISVAMDTSMGLAVPNIKNVHKLSILEIAKELNRLIISGRSGQFSQEDLSGGTFCISNIGPIGGTYAHPIILTPQVAIIAFGASKIVPRFDSANNVIAQEIVNISGTADHRIIDGATMARFVQLLKKQIENPHLLLLN